MTAPAARVAPSAHTHPMDRDTRTRRLRATLATLVAAHKREPNPVLREQIDRMRAELADLEQEESDGDTGA